MNRFWKSMPWVRYGRVLIDEEMHCTDVWQKDDDPGYVFHLRIVELKERWKKPYYQVDVPDYSVRDFNLGVAIWKVMCQVHDHGKRYTRLLKHYRNLEERYSILEQMHDKLYANVDAIKLFDQVTTIRREEEEKCQNSQKSTPNERT